MVLKGHPRGKTTDLVQALSEKTTSVASKIHLPKVNRAFHLLVSLLWPILVMQPKGEAFICGLVGQQKYMPKLLSCWKPTLSPTQKSPKVKLFTPVTSGLANHLTRRIEHGTDQPTDQSLGPQNGKQQEVVETVLV